MNKIQRTIERSSLGTPEAKRYRATVQRSVAVRVAAKSGTIRVKSVKGKR